MGLAKQLRHFRQNSYRSHYECTAVQYELNGVSTVGLFETRKTLNFVLGVGVSIGSGQETTGRMSFGLSTVYTRNWLLSTSYGTL